MLIVCPSCATSYLINPDSVGPAGRAVRCARCKSTWFVTAPKKTSNVAAFVDSVIAEAEAQSAEQHGGESPAPAPADDFGIEAHDAPPAQTTYSPSPDLAAHDTDAVSYENARPEPPAITDGPALVPPIEYAAAAAGVEADADDTDTFAIRRQRLKSRRKQARRSSRWTAIILVLFAFNVALLGARNEVVRYLPQTASLFAAIGLPVNLRNLKFENVHISRETDDGKSILVIEGNIVSAAGKAAEVPRLRFAARNAAGQEVYVWTALPSRSILGPGESLDFSSRLV
jgi:predicted Zn finger-like uncharacterized protein